MLMTTVEMLTEQTDGILLFGEPSWIVSGLTIDSRRVLPGAVFVAFAGEKSDGHDHLASAIDAGARALIVTVGSEELSDELFESAAGSETAIVQVEDALKAVQDLARAHRQRLRSTVVAITGSTGKTTTKDLVAAVLASKYRTLATEGNRNNELGVPLTILEADANTEMLVVEMGMRGAGQIAELCDIARPDHGLITNVGTSHIEILGSESAIASAKGELLESLPEGGRAYLNGDDVRSAGLASLSSAPVTMYGLGSTCDVFATDIDLDELSRPSFTATLGSGASQRVELSVSGRHNVYNALAALAVGEALDVPLDSMADALAGASMTAMRMEVFRTASGFTIMNDAYNANPTSMRAAVDTLASMSGEGSRIAVLGDMFELGSFSELAHFRLGGYVADAGIDLLVTVGPLARRIAEGAKASGMAPEAVKPCDDAFDALDLVQESIGQGDTVLVKASRAMSLERIVEGLVSPRV